MSAAPMRRQHRTIFAQFVRKITEVCRFFPGTSDPTHSTVSTEGFRRWPDCILFRRGLWVKLDERRPIPECIDSRSPSKRPAVAVRDERRASAEVERINRTARLLFRKRCRSSCKVALCLIHRRRTQRTGSANSLAGAKERRNPASMPNNAGSTSSTSAQQ